MNKYLIIGQGNIGLPVACELSKRHSVVGVSRTPKHYQDSGDITHWQMDALALTAEHLAWFTHIAIIVAPSWSSGDRVQAYQDSYLAICRHIASMAEQLGSVRQVLFVSSTSVYGDDDGRTIDEHTLAVPNSQTARILLDSENAIVKAFGKKAVIVRPSGIYGKQRLRMISLAKSAHADGVPSAHYTNRIMDSDLVAVLVRILSSDDAKPLYLASDFEPVTSADVMTYICQTLNAPLPKLISAPPTGKKIISNLPKDWLQFADYRRGYAWVLADCVD